MQRPGRVAPHRRRVALVGAFATAFVLEFFCPVLSAQANDCNVVLSCNLEAQRSPVITWPRGVSADFPTVSAAVTNVVVNSVAVIVDNDNSAEVGWYLGAGRNRFNPFSVSVYNGVYTQYDAPAPAGNFTFKYTVKYSASGCTVGNPCFIAVVDNGSSTYWTEGMPNAPFSTGTAATNAERHDSTDTWGGTPTFTNLQVLSSSAWSSWPAAQCLFDNDSMYRNNYFTSPTKVTVTLGSTC